MKKSGEICLLFLTLLCILAFTLPASSMANTVDTNKSSFDQLLKANEMKEKAEKLGKFHYLELADSVEEKNLKHLVPQFLKEKEIGKKLTLACALMSQVFPNSDPANWETVDGFLPCNTNIPLQLCALDALMQAVVIFVQDGSEESLLTARYLVERLGSSSYGKYYFITETPVEFRKAMDILVDKTLMVPGIWTSDNITGHLPLTPRYGGCISDDYAVQENMQFFNGMYQLASYGPYAWDRRRGRFYYVVSTPCSPRYW
ncbi:MAG: hypothetical protein Q4C78_03220 [Synergistaceae bacterium]|nr:hypothetical protein [Synergistaceae bacterium]